MNERNLSEEEAAEAPAASSGEPPVPEGAFLLHERARPSFREVFGRFLAVSTEMDAAILHVRLGAVDLTAAEMQANRRMRVLVAEANARTLEGEAYALLRDREKRVNLDRILALLENEILHLRSAPLGGWSPDFSVFSREGEPTRLLLGLHWFRRPFPHRGPAWAAGFGAREARLAKGRFETIWEQAHDIGTPVLRILENVRSRERKGPPEIVDTPGGFG
jgi:hypothetical protein